MVLPNNEGELRRIWHAVRGAGDQAGGWRAIARSESSRIHVGIRFPELTEALLFGFNCEIQETGQLPQGRGFELEKLSAPLNSDYPHWLSIARRDMAEIELFSLMANDLCSHAFSASGFIDTRHYHDLIRRVRSWQDFMEKSVSGRLSDYEEMGLFGELVVFRDLLKAGMPPAQTLQLWTGPRNGLQDFMSDTVGFEVKSTSSTASYPVRIGSLDQLDDTGPRKVFLCGQKFIEAANGERLPDLIQDIGNRIATGSDKVQWERMLQLAGFDPIHTELYVRRFSLANRRIYVADDQFPCLARSRLPAGFVSGEYVVDLNEVSVDEISYGSLLEFFGGIYDA